MTKPYQTLPITYATYFPDPPELPSHLTYPHTCPTHLPDLLNLPEPTDNLPEPSDNFPEPTDNLHQPITFQITDSADITILTIFHKFYQI